MDSVKLIGWLFAIGGSHVSDRLPRPHHQREGKLFWFKIII